MQASEPGDVLKTKLTDKIETTLWDRWEVDGKNSTLREVIAKVEAKYEGLTVRDVLQGGAPIFFHAIMNAPGKEKDKEQALNSMLAELVGAIAEGSAEPDEPYIDLTITCVPNDDPTAEVLEGVPPLRVKLI